MMRHSRQGKAAESYWATWDLNGNVIGEVSTTKEGRMALYDYDAFGQTIRVNEPEADLNPVRFSSKHMDEETGLVYYGYRYYPAELEHLISRDPIGEKEESIFMVGNDAVNKWDYLGRDPMGQAGASCGCPSSQPVPGIDKQQNKNGQTTDVKVWNCVFMRARLFE